MSEQPGRSGLVVPMIVGGVVLIGIGGMMLVMKLTDGLSEGFTKHLAWGLIPIRRQLHWLGNRVATKFGVRLLTVPIAKGLEKAPVRIFTAKII